MTTKKKHDELYIFGLITPSYFAKGFELNVKKVGVSGKGEDTTLNRLQTLNSKQHPFQVMCHKRWKFTDIDALVVEKHLHKMFRLEGRESPRGDKSTEWWSDTDDNLIEIVESQVALLQKLGHKVEELSAAETDEGVPSPTDAVKTRNDKEVRRTTTTVFTELTQDGEFEKHFKYNKPYRTKELAAIIEKNYPAWSASKNTKIKSQVAAEISNRDDGFWSKHLGVKAIVRLQDPASKGWTMTFVQNN